MRNVKCDALVLSLGLLPRDGLLRMAPDDKRVLAAGDVFGITGIDKAEAYGTKVAEHIDRMGQAQSPPLYLGDFPGAGYVCLCEDVAVSDLEQAWQEGWHSSEILKRYTTATMGPCQVLLPCRSMSSSQYCTCGVAPGGTATGGAAVSDQV